MSLTLVDQNSDTRAVISSEKIRPDASRVEVLGETLVLPGELLKRYIAVAMGSARPHELEPGQWYAELEGFPGVWADGDSPKTCLDTLAQVLEDWIILKVTDGDRDLPIVDGIELTVLCR